MSTSKRTVRTTPDLESRPPVASTRRVSVRAVAFDFENKTTQSLELAQVEGACQGGRFVWLDIDLATETEPQTLLSSFELLDPETIERMLTDEPAVQVLRFESYLHLVLSGCSAPQDRPLAMERVDVAISERLLLTVHQGARRFLDTVRQEYRRDFERYAKSPSFMIYEIFDALTDHFVQVQKTLERRVHALQRQLVGGDPDPGLFSRVSELWSDLLHYRSILVPTRTALSELSTRRSPFVAEATQAFLGNMVGTVERVLQDVLVDRDILSQSLSLQMSITADRTNRAMSKLTVISTVFLPLSFLCGVYGMNFTVIPELQWPYGYGYFWGLVVLVVLGQLIVMRRARLL